MHVGRLTPFRLPFVRLRLLTLPVTFFLLCHERFGIFGLVSALYNGMRPIACSKVHLLLLLVSAVGAVDTVHAIAIVKGSVFQRFSSTTNNNGALTELVPVLGTANAWTRPVRMNQVVWSWSLLRVELGVNFRIQILIRLVGRPSIATRVGSSLAVFLLTVDCRQGAKLVPCDHSL